MNNPVVSYGGTDIDLGMTVGKPKRILQERSATRRTLGGLLRTSVLSWNYEYQFDCTGLRSLYDSLVTLRDTAIAAGGTLTFSWTDLWPSANGVAVWVEVGPYVWDVPGADSGSWDLTLTEVNPR